MFYLKKYHIQTKTFFLNYVNAFDYLCTTTNPNALHLLDYFCYSFISSFIHKLNLVLYVIQEYEI